MDEMLAVRPSFWRPNGGGAIILLFMPVLGWVILLFWWLGYRLTLLEADKQSVRLTRGVLGREEIRLRHSEIRSMRVNRNVVERMVGVGTLSIWTAGDKPELVVKNLTRPSDVLKQLEALRG